MWEDIITKHLWSAVAPHFIEAIYLPAAQADNPSNFNTAVDIKLKQWAERSLPDISVKVWLVLLNINLQCARLLDPGLLSPLRRRQVLVCLAWKHKHYRLLYVIYTLRDSFLDGELSHLQNPLSKFGFRTHFATTKRKSLKSALKLGSKITSRQMANFFDRFATLCAFLGFF